MKKIATLLLILVALSAASQNWKLLDENKTYFYKHSDSLLITNTIKIDSTVNSVLDSVFHIHATIKICDTCTIIPSDAVGGVLYHAYASEIFGNTPTYKVSSNDYQFSDGIIKQDAELSDTWIFNPSLSINATVVDKYETTLFGSLDSIKVIELSTLDTILISKNHGVIRYPDFENAGKYFLLCGFHEGQNSFGEYLPNMWRIYNFNVGDVFCYHLINEDNGSWEIIDRDVKVKVLENLSNNYGISYQVKVYISQTAEYGSFEEPYYYYSSTNYIDTFNLHLSEAYYENLFSGITDCPTNTYYDYQFTFYNSPFISSEILSEYSTDGTLFSGVRHIHTAQLGYQKKYSPFVINTDSLAYFTFYDWFPATVSFTEGLGRDSLNTFDFEIGGSNYLIGYIKAGDTTGTIFNFPEDLGFTEEPLTAIFVYPNPATTEIHLPENLQRISFINLSGQEVLSSENPNQTMFLGDLPKGMYLVQAIDANGNLSMFKLIIE